MAVFRVERNKNYTVMSNYHLRDKRLTLKAKGLLSQMLSLPDDWDYTLAGLVYINREKTDAIREAVRELEKAGYIIRSRVRDEGGRLRGTEYIIYEEPCMLAEEYAEARSTVQEDTAGQHAAFVAPENQTDSGEHSTIFGAPVLEKPMWENPTLENPTQQNKDKQNTDKRNKESFPFRESAERKSNDGMETEWKGPDTVTEGTSCTEQGQMREPAPEAKQEQGQGQQLASTQEHEKVLDTEAWMETIKRNIGYTALCQNRPHDAGRLDEIVALMLETLCSQRRIIRIAGDDFPAPYVKGQFLKLDSGHIELVLDGLQRTTSEIRSIKQYMKAALFNAASTIENYYTALVAHDMRQSA